MPRSQLHAQLAVVRDYLENRHRLGAYYSVFRFSLYHGIISSAPRLGLRQRHRYSSTLDGAPARSPLMPRQPDLASTVGRQYVIVPSAQDVRTSHSAQTTLDSGFRVQLLVRPLFLSLGK